MDKNQRSYNGLVEINDIISDAVNNAIERRNQADVLSSVSDEQATKVAGGVSIPGPIVLGIIAPLPTIPSIS